MSLKGFSRRRARQPRRIASVSLIRMGLVEQDLDVPTIWGRARCRFRADQPIPCAAPPSNTAQIDRRWRFSVWGRGATIVRWLKWLGPVRRAVLPGRHRPRFATAAGQKRCRRPHCPPGARGNNS
jgi:hypothetical protein